MAVAGEALGNQPSRTSESKDLLSSLKLTNGFNSPSPLLAFITVCILCCQKICPLRVEAVVFIDCIVDNQGVCFLFYLTELYQISQAH
ncbi:hypothetical protein GJAV_G00020140 [Gymnothorax javanicus]|nr:hypothetical protein GJAV_G00020140 [Gymnothorax javanicus]